MLVQLGVPLLLGAWEEEQRIGLGLLQVKGGGRRPMSKVNLKETDRPVCLGDPGYKEWEGCISGQEEGSE